MNASFVKEDYYGGKVVDLLPHQPPFLQISSLTLMEAEEAITTLEVKEDNVMVCQGQLTEPGLLENMAQTAALSAGYSYFIQNQGKLVDYQPPLGYLGAIKKVEFHELPSVNESIETHTTIINTLRSGETDILFVKGKIRQGDRLCAEGEIKVFLTYP
ncbi:hypothetical protein KFE98_05795 [bacterium SCSIO 12741]|nr:hypothetical protein KFE98_05795 [bacterium SCSIO 12741]